MDEGIFMNPTRRYVRNWLKTATKSDYDKVVSEANLTDRQLNILNNTILKETSQVKQSMDDCCDVSCIKRTIKQVYDKIYVALVNTFYDT